MMDSRVILPKCLRYRPAGTPGSHARTHTLPPSLPRGSAGRGVSAAGSRVCDERRGRCGGRGQGRGHQGGPRERWLGPPGRARRARAAGAGAGSGGAREKAAAPGLAQTPAPPSPRAGGPPRPPRRRRRGSPQPGARRRARIHRGVSAASGRRRLLRAWRVRSPPPPAPAPGRARPCPRPPPARPPGRRALLRLRAASADAHPRPGLPGAQRLLRARPPPRHTHTFSSFSELEHRSGRRRRGRRRRGRAREEGSGGRGRPASPGRLSAAPRRRRRRASPPPRAPVASPAPRPAGSAPEPGRSRPLPRPWRGPRPARSLRPRGSRRRQPAAAGRRSG
ncbi:collagen alpha-1(I) chain-like [Talpa occidentalis]|uniref:collagen alpha-1(I) chain-like n=1 Tax=Talpa occidentalis TaxID=50954 RepID=UPI00188ECC46|nr:collagen alpha-1(I) chain-like [Talpa occidentalis]